MNVRRAGYATAILTGLCAIALMATAAWLLATASLQPPILHLQVAIVGVRAFALGRAALRYLERMLSHSAAFADLTDARVALFDRLRPLMPAGIDTRSSQVLSTIVTDVDRLQDRPLRGIGPLVTGLSCAIITCIAIGSLLPVAGIVLAVSLAVAGAISLAVSMSVAARAEREVAPLGAALESNLLETLRARDVLVAFGAWSQRVAELVRSDAELAARTRRLATAAGAASALALAAAGLTTVVAVLVSDDAGLTPGLTALIVLVPLALFEVWAALPTAVLVLREVRQRRERIETTATGVALPEAGDDVSPRGALELRDFQAHHSGQPKLAAPVTFVAHPGDVVVLVGESGVGKSTIAAALVRFVPSVGVATVGGVSLASLSAERLRETIVLVEQLPHLFDTSLRENLRFARDTVTDDELWAVLERVGLSNWAEARDGLDTAMGDRASLVSGGQAQRIALARGLLADAPVLVLDEPTANVDVEVADTLMRDVLEASRAAGRIVVVTSHVALPAGTVTQEVTIRPACDEPRDGGSSAS